MEGGSPAHTCMGAVLLLVLIIFVHLAIAKWLIDRRMKARVVAAKQAEMEARKAARNAPPAAPEGEEGEAANQTVDG